MVSGVKRDSDLGRTLQSDASKRNCTGELQRKNLELSGPVQKFLKTNHEASMKDFSENGIGLPVWKLSMILSKMK
jgi:hypothetical protein